MRLAVFTSLSLQSACASTGVQQKADWGSQVDAKLVASIDSLVGPNAVDCGLYNLTGGAPPYRIRLAAHDCVDSAVRAGQTFKYGTLRIPIDSDATEVIARTADGKLRLIVRDVMIGEGFAQQWNQICQEVGVDPHTMIVEAERCVEESSGQLAAQ